MISAMCRASSSDTIPTWRRRPAAPSSSMPEALSHQIAETRGDLEKQNLLGQLAVQFGEATGRYGALRDYIGRMIEVKRPAKRRAGDDGKRRGTKKSGSAVSQSGPTTITRNRTA